MKRRRVDGGERGSAVNVQVAVLFSLILITVLTLLQAGLFFYGRDLALSAARSGVDTGRTYGTVDARAAQDHARTVLGAHAHGVLTNPSAAATANGATMTVTVEHPPPQSAPRAHPPSPPTRIPRCPSRCLHPQGWWWRQNRPRSHPAGSR